MSDRIIPRPENCTLVTTDKVRYRDTDRQGHVNNAVFSSFLETGRVELLYDPQSPLAEPGGSFVIANILLEFHREITWPGEIRIGTRVTRVGRSSIGLEQGLFQADVCVARAETVIVHTNDATRASMPIGERAVERLSGLIKR